MMAAETRKHTKSFLPSCRGGKHICREAVRLFRSPLLCSRLHSLRTLPCAASKSQQASSEVAADDCSDHLSVRRQLQAGRKLGKTQIRGYKVAQLREALQEEGLSTTGLKAELVERLYELVQSLSEHTAEQADTLESSSTAEQPSRQNGTAEQLSAFHSMPAQHDTQNTDLIPQPTSAAAAETSASASSNTAAPLLSPPLEDSGSSIEVQQLSTALDSAPAQPEPSRQDVSRNGSELAAAAVPVPSMSRPAHGAVFSDLDTPDKVALKTGAA